MYTAQSYHANGKLLLTGEYLLLHGAKGIALPLKKGQNLMVTAENDLEMLEWNAYYGNRIWFSCKLNPRHFSVLETSDPGKAETLSFIFHTIRDMNPDSRPMSGLNFTTVIDANPDWGLGSSSTLISLMAQFSGVDPYLLNSLVFNGSGFDIACAKADGPIFYSKNNPVQPVTLDYPFSDQLFLVYSGVKKKTHSEVNTFLKSKRVTKQIIGEGSALADAFSICRDQKEFGNLIQCHEELIGHLIGKTPVKMEYFFDFDGEIKSLGAWGGDFYLASSTLPISKVKTYFGNKGLIVLFKWNDLILNR